MSLKLFYSQLNLHSSALHECLKRCSPAMQACLETYDDTLYCITPGAGLQWVWRKNSFLGAWRERQRKWGKSLKSVAFPPRSRAKRQRKKGNPAKSVAFKAGKKPKRQRKWGKSLKSVASPPRSRAKRQRKWGKSPKSVASPPRSRAKRQRKWGKSPKSAASPPTSSPPTTPLPQAPLNSQNHSGRNEKNMLS